MKVSCYCTNVRRAANALTRLYDAALEPVGLKVTQYALLRMVDRLEAPAIGALAAEASLDPTTLNRNLKPLEQAGYLRVEPGADARRKLVRLTGTGREVLARALPHWQVAQRQVEEALVDKLNPEFMATLEKLHTLA